MSEDFVPFPKIPRLNRDIVITEKIDGTNAQIVIGEDGSVRAGSRNRWITPEDDNYGFARWVRDNTESLLQLGPGRHFGEWWGQGIQRGYDLTEKRFSLFNTGRWGVHEHDSTVFGTGLIHVVPVLYQGPFSQKAIDTQIFDLKSGGSVAKPGFKNPEGVVVFHVAGSHNYKVLCENDEGHKG